MNSTLSLRRQKVNLQVVSVAAQEKKLHGYMHIQCAFLGGNRKTPLIALFQ
jgi:hypothetical protein